MLDPRGLDHPTLTHLISTIAADKNAGNGYTEHGHIPSPSSTTAAAAPSSAAQRRRAGDAIPFLAAHPQPSRHELRESHTTVVAGTAKQEAWAQINFGETSEGHYRQVALTAQDLRATTPARHPRQLPIARRSDMT